MFIENRRELENGDYFKIAVWTKGIKKRARLSKRHCVDIGYIPYPATPEGITECQKEAITQQAKQRLAENMRQIDTAQNIVKMDKITISENGVSMLWEPFSKLNKQFAI